MTHPLDEARAKVARAFRHLEELNNEVHAFADAHPYSGVLDFDSEAPKIVIRAKAAVPDEPVPLVVGVIVGDVLNNLRSALEYLAWQLAIIGKGPDKDTHFPICDTRDKWRDWGNGNVKRLQPKHAAVIERVQPYHGRQTGALLFIIARLNNTDKHAVVSATSWAARFEPPKIAGGIRAMRIGFEEGGLPMYDGAPIARILHLELAPGVKVDVKMPVTYTILFGEPSLPDEIFASLGALRFAARYVRRILRVFENEFPV
jgi:hypothetical protein